MLENFYKRNSAPIKTLFIFLISGLMVFSLISIAMPNGAVAGEEDVKGVFINEVGFNSTASADWIEIRNTRTNTINLRGWKIKNSLGDLRFIGINHNPADNVIGDDLVIGSGDYLTLYLAPGFSLGNASDLITLDPINTANMREADRVRYIVTSDTAGTKRISVYSLASTGIEIESISDIPVKDNDSFGRFISNVYGWCVFETKTPSAPNQSLCRSNTVPTLTPTPSASPTITLTPSPTATVTPTASTTPVVTLSPVTTSTPTPSPVITTTPVATSTPTPTQTLVATPSPTMTPASTLIPTNTVISAPFANGRVSNNYTGNVFSQLTPTPTTTAIPTTQNIIKPSNGNTTDIALKNGERMTLVNNSNTCEVFESYTFTAKKDISGRITFNTIDNSGYVNKPFENKNLFYGLCKFELENFNPEDVSSVSIKVKYDQVWLRNNKFTTDQLKLYAAETDVNNLNKKFDLSKTEDKQVEDKKYDVLEANLNIVPKAFTIAPDGVEEIVKSNNTNFPWVLLAIGAGLLALVLTVLLLPKKSDEPVEENVSIFF